MIILKNHYIGGKDIMKKKLYTCRHQKNAAEPCDTCKKTRGNYGGGQEQGYHCDKCGKLIAKGTL